MLKLGPVSQATDSWCLLKKKTLTYGCLFDQVTFVVTHFNDPRISSADLKDLLLQSISVLVQYREYLTAFESNKTAILRLPKALLSAFDQRSWIPVTNILLRLCRGSSFGSSKHGESSSSSVIFQVNSEDFFFFDYNDVLFLLDISLSLSILLSNFWPFFSTSIWVSLSIYKEITTGSLHQWQRSVLSFPQPLI